MMFEEGEYYSPSDMIFSCLDLSMSHSKKQKLINKRRFSDEQVKSLESIFENQTKLEPKKKLQLARDLGLQPRQVAIWFQNKRARYKSKQLEHDYAILSSKYNALASQFDSLNKETQALLLQVQKLRGITRNGDEKQDDEGGAAHSNSNNISEFGNYKNKSEDSETEEKKKLKGENDDQSDNERKACEFSMEAASILSDDEGSTENTTCLETNEMDIVKMMDLAAPDSLTRAEPAWVNHHRSDEFFDQAGDSGQWWDFWS